jgi:hypothetical protein
MAIHHGCLHFRGFVWFSGTNVQAMGTDRMVSDQYGFFHHVVFPACAACPGYGG